VASWRGCLVSADGGLDDNVADAGDGRLRAISAGRENAGGSIRPSRRGKIDGIAGNGSSAVRRNDRSPLGGSRHGAERWRLRRLPLASYCLREAGRPITTAECAAAFARETGLEEHDARLGLIGN